MTGGDRAHAVVVGAGVVGAALARELAGRGWSVELIEQHEPGHVRASSGGETRLIRCGHGSDTWYTDSAWRALTAWEDLEDEGDVEVLLRRGVAWFAHETEGWEADSLQTMTEAGIPAERLTPAEATSLFPSLRTDDLAWVLWEPLAGVLRAREAVRALVHTALGRGGVLRRGLAIPAADGTATVDGEPMGADATVWACGPWLGRWWPDAVDLRVTQQDVCFFGPPPESDWTAPGWVDYSAGAYGVGDVDGRGVKCSSDAEGPPFDPDTGQRVPLPANIERARDLLAWRFPGLADAPLLGTRTCQYSLTADTHFIAAPAGEGVWITGGGSGHGFKHGPTWGSYLADLVEGSTAPDPRFALGPRGGGRRLRTAGGEIRNSG